MQSIDLSLLEYGCVWEEVKRISTSRMERVKYTNITSIKALAPFEIIREKKNQIFNLFEIRFMYKIVLESNFK